MIGTSAGGLVASPATKATLNRITSVLLWGVEAYPACQKLHALFGRLSGAVSGACSGVLVAASATTDRSIHRVFGLPKASMAPRVCDVGGTFLGASSDSLLPVSFGNLAE